VGVEQPPSSPGPAPAGHAAAFISGGAYAMLFLLGLAEGVIGSFQSSRAVIGSVPLAALAFCALILLSCGLAGWAMKTMAAALLVAIGWFVASFTLAMPNSGGSVIIANTSAGQWYLYGGAVCALLGVGTAFVTARRR